MNNGETSQEVYLDTLLNGLRRIEDYVPGPCVASLVPKYGYRFAFELRFEKGGQRAGIQSMCYMGELYNQLDSRIWFKMIFGAILPTEIDNFLGQQSQNMLGIDNLPADYEQAPENVPPLNLKGIVNLLQWLGDGPEGSRFPELRPHGDGGMEIYVRFKNKVGEHRRLSRTFDADQIKHFCLQPPAFEYMIKDMIGSEIVRCINNQESI